jgi:hypothetical protein
LDFLGQTATYSRAGLPAQSFVQSIFKIDTVATSMDSLHIDGDVYNYVQVVQDFKLFTVPSDLTFKQIKLSTCTISNVYVSESLNILSNIINAVQDEATVVEITSATVNNITGKNVNFVKADDANVLQVTMTDNAFSILNGDSVAIFENSNSQSTLSLSNCNF